MKITQEQIEKDRLKNKYRSKIDLERERMNKEMVGEMGKYLPNFNCNYNIKIINMYNIQIAGDPIHMLCKDYK